MSNPWPADKVERWPIAKLTPYAKNARTHTPEQIAKIAASIKEWGWTNPVLVDEAGGIIAGHARVLASQRLSLTEVPVMVATNWTEAQKRAYVIADNKIAESGAGWDMDLLRVEVGDLQLSGFDVDLMGFSGLEMADLLADRNAGLTDPDEVPEPPAEPVSRLGDVWVMGRHRLVCGDATSEADVALALGGVKPHMVLTDPPYGMGLDTDFSTIHGSLKSVGRAHGTAGKKYDKVIGDNADFSPRLIEAIFSACPAATEAFLFGADYYADILPNRNSGSWLVWDKRKESQAEAIGSEFELIWSKRHHKRRMLRHDWFGFLSSDNQQEARARVHPTQKPSSLLADIMQQWGKPGDTVADLYLGSGTTIIAAEMTGRACNAMEISPQYCDVAALRWQNFSGSTATLEGDGRSFSEVAAERNILRRRRNRLQVSYRPSQRTGK